MKLEPDDPTGWFENGRWIENTGLRFLAALRTAMADMRGALDTVSENYIEAVVDGSRWPGQFYKGAWLPARPLLSMIALAPVLAARTDDPRCEQALREIIESTLPLVDVNAIARTWIR